MGYDMQKHSTGVEQKRHWIGTIHHGHLSDGEYDAAEAEKLFEILLDDIHEGNIVGLTFAQGQMEITSNERLHLQLYCEFKTSLREKEVENRIPGRWDFRVGDKNSVIKYMTKTPSKVGMEFKWGTMKLDKVAPENRPKTRALMYLIQDGLTPAEIAILDPECYFTHYAAINALFNMRAKNTTTIANLLGGEEE